MLNFTGVNMSNAVERENFTITNFGYSAETLMIVYSVSSVLGILGVCGNAVSLVIWTRPELKSSTSVHLTALAVSDTLIIICLHFSSWISTLALYYHDSPTLGDVNRFVTPYVVASFFPVYRTARTVSTFLTLTIMLERYTAVCRPFKRLVVCTHGRACKHTAAVVIFSVLYNLVEFVRQKVVAVVDDSGKTTQYILDDTDLAKTDIFMGFYKIHRSWLYFILIFSLPLIFIVVLNTRIFLELKRVKKQRTALTDSQMQENKLTMMLVYVVVEFILCSSVTIFYTAFYMLRYWRDVKFNKASLYPVFSFVDTFNASSNFVTYATFGSSFRETLIKTIPCFGICIKKRPVSKARDKNLAQTGSQTLKNLKIARKV